MLTNANKLVESCETQGYREGHIQPASKQAGSVRKFAGPDCLFFDLLSICCRRVALIQLGDCRVLLRRLKKAVPRQRCRHTPVWPPHLIPLMQYLFGARRQTRGRWSLFHKLQHLPVHIQYVDTVLQFGHDVSAPSAMPYSAACA